MTLSAASAMWFLPFVLPICLYVVYTDLSGMKITNRAVMLLGLIYVLVGPFAMPSGEDYLWGFARFSIVLAIGFVLSATGSLGAGDAKFLAFAAPFIVPEDVARVTILFFAVLLAAFATHRLAKVSGLSKLAPDWKSWGENKRFPLGLALGPTLALYLGLAILNGA